MEKGTSERTDTNPPIPPGWRGEPRIIAFFIPIPTTIGLPNWSTYDLLRSEYVDWLKGKERLVIDQSGVTWKHPELSDGSNSVSIKVWRPKTGLRISVKPLQSAMQVVRAVLGGEMDDSIMEPDAGPTIEASSTVFEAVTPLLLSKDGTIGTSVSDAFDRVIEEVATMLRAAAIVIGDPKIRGISRQTVFYQIPFATRPPTTNEWGGLGVFTANIPINIPGGEPELNDNDAAKFALLLQSIKRNDPSVRYLETMFRARQAFNLDGDYVVSSILAYSASEAFFDTLLLLMLWEEGLSPQEVVSKLERVNLAARLRTHFPTRLGGNWDTTDASLTVGRWYDRVARLRHLVIHAGHRPTEREAKEALLAVDEVTDFANGRLVENRNRFKRVTLMFLAREGLERRNLYRGQIRKFAEDVAPNEDPWVVKFNMWVAALPWNVR